MLAKHKVGSSTLLTRSNFEGLIFNPFFCFKRVEEEVRLKPVRRQFLKISGET